MIVGCAYRWWGYYLEYDNTKMYCYATVLGCGFTECLERLRYQFVPLKFIGESIDTATIQKWLTEDRG